MSATSTTTSSALLPDPTDDVGAALTPGCADDLIASLADQQIDELLADAGAEEPSDAEAAIEAALDAASRLGEVAQALTASAAEDLKAELDRADPGPITPGPTLESTPEADPEPPILATAVAEEIAPAIEASPAALPSPSFNPPAPATIEAPKSIEPPADVDVGLHIASAHEESGAEAVARELAADVSLLSTPLSGVIEHDAEESAQDSKWRRALAAIFALPALLLGAINLPVRPLSDRGREIIGGVGIVTLVNAAGVLIYLAMFAHRH